MAVRRRYVCLLRGINVGGRNRVSMARLREACAEIGCEAIRTYIASGNLVCTSTLTAEELGGSLESVVERDFGIAIKVIVVAASRLEQIIRDQPFSNAEPNSLHVAFGGQAIDRETATALSDQHVDGEQVAVNGATIYYHLPNGLGRAKLPAIIDRKAKVPLTVRNWRTVLTLSDMAKSTKK